MDEQNNQQMNQAPKKKNGWLKGCGFGCGGLLLLIILMGGCVAIFMPETAEETASNAVDEITSDEDGTQDTEDVIEEETEVVEENLSIGDSATMDDITLTLDDAYYTDERNQFADIEPDHVLMIDVTIENNSGTDYPVGLDLELYVDGSKAETYPVETLMDSVSDGRSASGSQSFAIMGEPSEIELEFSPFMSFSSEKAIFDIIIE